MNNSKNNALGLLKNSAGDYCNNPTESLNVLLSKQFPGHAALSDLEFQKKDCEGMVWKTVKNNRLDKTFTVKKVKAAFAYMGSYKSAGPDGYKPIIMNTWLSQFSGNLSLQHLIFWSSILRRPITNQLQRYNYQVVYPGGHSLIGKNDFYHFLFSTIRRHLFLNGYK